MKDKYDVIRFILKCILIPAAAVIIILILNEPYREINDQKYMDTVKFTLLKDNPQQIQIANLGSSHGAYDFVYDAITRKGYSCFNFAGTSQSYNYDYAVLTEFGQDLTENSVLFIPISYFSFNNEVINSTEAEAMSLRYYRFLSPDHIPGYDPYIDIVTNRVPILSAGEDILQLFPKLNTVLTVQAADNGINTEEFIRRAQERYSRHFDNKEELFLPERIEDLRHIIEYCQERRITPVLITTPFSTYYNDLVSQDFMKEFYETIDAVASDTGVNYYDYSHDERFGANLEYFADSDHLNETGAAYFMDIIWDEVDELERFH